MWWIFAIFIVFIVLKQLLSHNISLDDARAKLSEGAVLIDVRTPGEFTAGRLDRAINIPLHELEKISQVISDKSQPILLYCHSGSRAAAACSRLRRMGYSNVSNVGSYSRTRKILTE